MYVNVMYVCMYVTLMLINILPSDSKRRIGTPLVQPSRSRVYFSKEDGLPRSVAAVPERFFRLGNGQWIRTLAGKGKKLWRKTARRKHRMQQHLFVNGQQCRLLDAMVNKEYKRRTFYADDPYEPYHRVERLPMYNFEKIKFLP